MAAPQGCLGDADGTAAVTSSTTDAELRSLLLDCLALWGVRGRVEADEAGLRIMVTAGTFRVQRADAGMRPVRWFLDRPGRTPRAVPSIVALLGALRHATGAAAGNALIIGASHG